MIRSTRWSLVLAFAGVCAFALPSMTDAFARGGGGGGGGGGNPSTGGGSGGGGSGGGKGAPSSGGGSKAPSTGGGSGKPQKANNTGNAKGRGDYLETLQREEDDDARPGFLGDAAFEVLKAQRAIARVR